MRKKVGEDLGKTNSSLPGDVGNRNLDCSSLGETALTLGKGDERGVNVLSLSLTGAFQNQTSFLVISIQILFPENSTMASLTLLHCPRHVTCLCVRSLTLTFQVFTQMSPSSDAILVPPPPLKIP